VVVGAINLASGDRRLVSLDVPVGTSQRPNLNLSLVAGLLPTRVYYSVT
jgi:hypothetical protein